MRDKLLMSEYLKDSSIHNNGDIECVECKAVLKLMDLRSGDQLRLPDKGLGYCPNCHSYRFRDHIIPTPK